MGTRNRAKRATWWGQTDPTEGTWTFSCYPPGAGELGAIDNGFSNLCPAAITISALKGLRTVGQVLSVTLLLDGQSLCSGL